MQPNVPGLASDEAVQVTVRERKETPSLVVNEPTTTKAQTTRKKQPATTESIVKPLEMDLSITRTDLVQEKGIIMGKPIGDIEFVTIKRLFEINELIFRLDQPEREVPSPIRSWRHVQLDNVNDWPECIREIMKLVKDREFNDQCFDFARKNDLNEIMDYLSNRLKVCPGDEEAETQNEVIDSAGLDIAELITALKQQNVVGLTWLANQIVVRESFWNDQIFKELILQPC